LTNSTSTQLIMKEASKDSSGHLDVVVVDVQAYRQGLNKDNNYFESWSYGVLPLPASIVE
jgi:hypothetical protein